MAGKGQSKHLFTKGGADRLDGLLKGSESGVHSRPIRAEETINKRFGDAVEIKADIGDRIGVAMCASHPWQPQQVRATTVSRW